MNIWAVSDEELVSDPFGNGYASKKKHKPPKKLVRSGQEKLLCDKAKHLVYHIEHVTPTQQKRGGGTDGNRVHVYSS